MHNDYHSLNHHHSIPECHQMINWEDHPVFRAVNSANVAVLQRILDRDSAPCFGRDRSNFIRNESGQTPLMLALARNATTTRGVLRKMVLLLLEKFKLDPNITDYAGRTALLYAILHRVDASIISLLLNRGADVKALDHDQLSPLMYAAALQRVDIVRFVCPDYRAQITATLKMKLACIDAVWLERQRSILHPELLEVPFRMEGSPKHYVPFLGTFYVISVCFTYFSTN